MSPLCATVCVSDGDSKYEARKDTCLLTVPRVPRNSALVGSFSG